MKTLTLLLTTALLMGCDNRDVSTDTENTPTVIVYELPYSSNDAQEFKLTDGTRCVTFSKSITCNWK